jgi:rSAM/selenodomain-associated transferase 2
MPLSVIVPTLNEAARVEQTLRHARQEGVAEIIVVDAGSADDTVERARPLADRVLSSARGRAAQMNAGAAGAVGDTLLFLHADTWVPPGFAAAVEQSLRDPGVVAGRFDVELFPSTPLLRLVAGLMNARSRFTGMYTGDQAIFVRRSVFEQMGGFARLPLFEDLELSRRLKRAGRLAPLRQRVSTSSRRWLADGPIQTILRMWTIRLLYFLGVSPERLSRAYADRR